jgi:hypothetical protein
MGKRTINAREILDDIKEEMDDSGQILNALNRLILLGLMLPSELAQRTPWTKKI